MDFGAAIARAGAGPVSNPRSGPQMPGEEVANQLDLRLTGHGVGLGELAPFQVQSGLLQGLRLTSNRHHGHHRILSAVGEERRNLSRLGPQLAQQRL